MHLADPNCSVIAPSILICESLQFEEEGAALQRAVMNADRHSLSFYRLSPGRLRATAPEAMLRPW